jgi:hypothetical protein
MRWLIIAEGARKNDLLAGPTGTGAVEFEVVGPTDGWEHLAISSYEAVVHVTLDETPYDLEALSNARFVFGSSVLTSFWEYDFRPGLVGINGLPYFVGLKAWEICASSDEDYRHAQSLLGRVGIVAHRVNAGVGMVGPRVLFPIINEAYRVWAEKTAAFHDIETAMKLGVNYPWGPFEWAKKIGPENVAAVLSALAKEYGPQYLPVSALKYARQGPSTVMGLG